MYFRGSSIKIFYLQIIKHKQNAKAESGKVISKSQSTKIITLKMIIKNLENELLTGEAKVFLRK